MSTFVCFECRTTERQPFSRITRNCRVCRRPAEYVYWKLRIPKKDDDKGWIELARRTRANNDKIKKRMLTWEQAREARYERMLANTRDPERRRRLESALRNIRGKIARWEQWR